MPLLHCIWNDKCLSVPTKIHLFQALVLSVLLYASETWTLRVADMKTLEAFSLKCLWQILAVRWHQQITNSPSPTPSLQLATPLITALPLAYPNILVNPLHPTKCKFSAPPLLMTPYFIAPTTIPGHSGVNLKIWRQSPYPFPSYERAAIYRLHAVHTKHMVIFH